MKIKIAGTFLMMLMAWTSVTGQELKIVIFSINSADATLIIFPTGKTMMVDSGTAAMCTARVMPFLQRHCIDHLDYYVDTHGHKDHYEGRIPLTAAGIIDETTKTWNKFVNDGTPAKHAQVYYNRTDEGSKPLLYGSQFEMEGTNWFISNREDVEFFGTGNANVNSLAFRMEYNGFTYSHGGDEARLSMNRYLKDYPELVEVDVRNTAHHMRGPINQDYLTATNAELWVVSNMPGMSSLKTYWDMLQQTVVDLQGNGKDHEAIITGDVGHVVIRASGEDDWSYESSLDYNNSFFDYISNDTNNDCNTTQPLPRVGGYLDDADALTGWKSSGSNALSLNTTDKQQGEASVEMTGKDGQEFKKAFSPVYDAQGTVDNTILKFSYYVSDVSLFTDKITIEISSSGAADTAEYNWMVNKTELVNGWNDIELRVSDAGISLGGIPTEPDLSAINWFRLFGGKTDVITTRIDGIQLFNEDVVLSVNSINKANIKIYPNPSKDFIELSNQIETKNYKLYNKLGQLVKKGTLDVNEKINIQNLNQGLYILKFDNGASLKLLKQ